CVAGAGGIMPEREPRAVFVSYARGDIPFAHWMARELAREGISCWIDVERLVPGAGWSLAINSGLDGCDGLLLIATAESLASPYCRREWQHAMAAGKPVVVAAIEIVTVPHELAECPVIDLRVWDGTPWLELAKTIRTGTSSDPNPKTLDRIRLT